jgi:uncharacterized spore protein YtfJ
MDPSELMEKSRDVLTVKRVFGEPYEHDGLTVIPAASIRGGAGGGKGEGTGPDGEGTGSGSGGGFGVTARPAGVYVVEGKDVRWRPAVDVNRAIIGGQIIAIVFLLVLRSILKSRR